MKKLLAILLTLAMVFGLVACTAAPAATTTETKTEAAPAGDIEIAVVLKTLASEYWGYVKDGCDEAAKEFGVKVTVVGPGAESDIEGQVAMIEQQIGAGCSAIVCAPNDAAAASAALQAAIDAGIPVLAVDTNVGIAGQTSFVGTMNDEAAKQGGLWAAEQLGAGAKAVIIYGQEGDNTSNLRRAGYEAAINETGMVLLDALSGQNTTDGATKTMEDLLTKHGGDIDVVFCHNDDTAIGAMNACKSAGKEDIMIVGFDGNQSAKDLIDAGSTIKATVCQQPHAMGYEVVKAALAAIKGEKVEETIAAPVEIYAANAAAPAEPAAAKDVEIAVVLKTLASEYWGYVKDGCEAAATDLGIKITIVGPGAESDIEGQVAMIEQQIGAGCDAIVCAPNDAAAAGAALQAAIDAGIPVLAVDTNVGIAGQTCFVGTMNDVAAKQGGDWAAAKLGAGAKAVIIYGQEGDNTSNLRTAGYEAAIAEAGMVLLDKLSGQNTTDGATKTMEDLLTKHNNEIDVVFCMNDDTAIGAMNACKSAGVEDIIIVGFDGNQSAKDLIDAGTQIKATVCQQPYAMGYEVVKAALAAINGEAVDEVIAAPVEIYAAN